jgi:hypothetical protein
LGSSNTAFTRSFSAPARIRLMSAAFAQRKVQRVNQNRLARARFARERVEPRLERHLQPIDYRQILDVQGVEHCLNCTCCVTGEYDSRPAGVCL